MFDNGLYMAPSFKELLPLVYEKHRLKRRQLSNMNSFDYNSMKLGHIIKYHNMFKFQNGPYRIMSSGVIALYFRQFPIYKNLAIAGASVSHGHISSFNPVFSRNSLTTHVLQNYVLEILNMYITLGRRHILLMSNFG